MVRRILGVVVGFLLGYLIVSIAASLTMVMFGAAFSERHEVVPIGGMLALLVGEAIGAFAGAWVAMQIGRWSIGVWIVAALIALANVILTSTLIGAAWLMVAGIVLPLASAALITRVGAKTPA